MCCFYKANDSRVEDKIDDQYERNLKRYDGWTVDKFHEYLANKMSAWLTRFLPQDDEDYEDPHTAPVQQQDQQGEESQDVYEMSEQEENEGLKIGDGRRNDDNHSTAEDSENGASDKEGASG